MALNQWKVTYKDYSNEAGVFSLHSAPLAPDGSNYAAQLTAFNTLIAATGNIVLGRLARTALLVNTPYSQAAANDASAQREAKWLVTYEDTTQYLDAPTNTVLNPGYHNLNDVEIPTADLTLRSGHDDVVYTDDGVTVSSDDAVITAFANAFNAFQKSPTGGSVTIRKITAVGRNT